MQCLPRFEACVGKVYCSFSLASYLGSHKLRRKPRYLRLGNTESGHSGVRLGIELAYRVDTLARNTIYFVMSC